MKWPRWSSFKKNWMVDAAARSAEETKQAAQETIEKPLPTPSKSPEATCNAPTTYHVPLEHPIQRPTRAEVLERFPGNRGSAF